jgi:hypothetical protein
MTSFDGWEQVEGASLNYFGISDLNGERNF